jgi:hypothetical protein
MSAGGIPSKCLDETISRMKQREQSGSRESAFFHKNASPESVRPRRWDYPELDLWLIEVWPLVEQYFWTYKDVYDLALERFKDEDESAKVLDRVEYLKERCNKLELHLSPEAQKVRGRPKAVRDDEEPITTFGERVGLRVAHLYADCDEEIPPLVQGAHQCLAEMAVAMEPFTRLLEGRSKEPFFMAVPRFKKGGEKFPSGAPFFQSLMPQTERHDNETN